MKNDIHNLHPDRDGVDHRVDIWPDFKSKKENKIEIKNKSSRIGLGRIFAGIIILLIGLIYLVKNFEIFSGFDLSVFQLLSVIIIFIGLSLLSVRRWLLTMISFVVIGFIFLFIFFYIYNNFSADREIIDYPFFIEEFQEIDSAIVVMKYGIGNLSITSNEKSSISGNLKTNFTKLETSSRFEGSNTQRVTINTLDSNFLYFGDLINTINVSFPEDLPMDIYIDSDSAQMDLDLTSVTIKGLDIDTNTSDINLAMYKILDNAKIKIDAGVSFVNIVLPKNIGAELSLSGGLALKDVSGFVPIDSGYYLSEGYEDKDIQIELDLDLGPADLKINWIE